MNNQIYNIPNDWFNFKGELSNNNNNLETPIIGFQKGNMFKNLYDPYKNYKFGLLKPKNEKEERLFDILKLKFALTDLNLYLDVFPNNTSYINTFNKYLEEEKKLCKEYEKKYGPLTLDNINEENNWEWIKSPWPWEGNK